MATTKRKEERIAREEWDFCKESLPDDALGVCLLYEYAREKLKRSPKLQKLFKECMTPFSLSLYLKLTPYFSGDYGSATFGADLLKTPWLKSLFVVLCEDKNTFGVRKGDKPVPAFFREEGFYQDMDFPKWVTPLDHFKWLSPSIMRSVTARNPEEQDLRYGFFCIDLNMADKPIVDQFTAWLDIQRPKKHEGEKRNAKNDGTGKSFTAIKQRTLLKQLGATRLMAIGMTAEEAISYSQEKSKNNKSIYSAPKEWSVAKNEVEHGILKLFPVRVR
jgi:hypothetical protein